MVVVAAVLAVTLQYKTAVQVSQALSLVQQDSMLAVAVAVQTAVQVTVVLVLADVDLFVVKLQNLVLPTLGLVAVVTDVAELAVMVAQAL
jgi:hypothetical protein